MTPQNAPSPTIPLRTYRRIRVWRRVSQGAFLLLFLVFLLITSFDAKSSPDILPRISAPVGFFLEIDPLVAILTVVSTHALYRNLIWAVALLVLTLTLGRFFCGWICPLGTLNQMVSTVRSGRLRGGKRLAANRYHPYQRWKYGILAFFLGAAAFTSLQIGLLDPIVLLTRALALSLVPAWNVLVDGGSAWLASLNAGFLTPAAGGLAAGLQFLATRAKPVHFEGGLLIALLFAAVAGANRFVTRFWCRGLCPLGALLGVFSRYAIFGMEKHPSLCTDCNLCALNCQGGDDPQPGYVWRQAECHLCFNCVAECPEAGIRFGFFPKLEETRQNADIARRALLASLGAGAAIVPILRAEPVTGRGHDPTLVRPPGSIPERDFLSRCIRCGECMNVCPNNALHPTLLQAGMEGIWSPILLPRIGYCEPTCVLCSQVCPTGAIGEITEKEKGWVPVKGEQAGSPSPVRIGTAFYDLGRCLPWAMAVPCIVCEEWCPTSPKAIFFEEAEAQNRAGEFVTVKRPRLDPKLCVGCGACTFACPVKGEPAIYIRSTGETRNPENGILLNARRAS